MPGVGASCFTINQSSQDPGLVLSRPCQAYKSELPSYQYHDLASLELPGSFWNGQSHAAHSNAGSEETWWDWINPDCVLDESDSIHVNQGSRIASSGVSIEIPSTIEARVSSTEAAFQTICHTSGSRQPSFGLDLPANSDIGLRTKALLAYSDGTNSKVVRDSTSPAQFDWNPTTSSSVLSYDCDLSDNNSSGFTTPLSKISYEQSQGNPKSQIPRANPSKCPHCHKIISRKQFMYAPLL